MKGEVKVFVAYSFDKTQPEGETLSDVDVAKWFIGVMRKVPLKYHVVTGDKPEPGPIADKIKGHVSDCNCVVAIFTKRHRDAVRDRWLPPQFVLCEAAAALGFYHNTNKIICGFYEEGLDPKDLALITIGGLELIPFTRATLEADRSRFTEYLKRIPIVLSAGMLGSGQLPLFKPPYLQQRMRKVVTVYNNGNFTSQNINRVLITDAGRFADNDGSRIKHVISHSRASIPPLSDMLATHLGERRQKAFLAGMLWQLNPTTLDTPLDFALENQKGHTALFTVGFRDSSGMAIAFKNGDIVRYQYAWGIPHAYLPHEEDLPSASPGTAFDPKEYNTVDIAANHGEVQEMILELRFERARQHIFSKEPFFQLSPSASEVPHWSSPENLPLFYDDDEDHRIWFQSFRISIPKFQGRLRVLWRPSSRKHDVQTGVQKRKE